MAYGKRMFYSDGALAKNDGVALFVGYDGSPTMHTGYIDLRTFGLFGNDDCDHFFPTPRISRKPSRKMKLS